MDEKDGVNAVDRPEERNEVFEKIKDVIYWTQDHNKTLLWFGFVCFALVIAGYGYMSYVWANAECHEIAKLTYAPAVPLEWGFNPVTGCTFPLPGTQKNATQLGINWTGGN